MTRTHLPVGDRYMVAMFGLSTLAAAGVGCAAQGTLTDAQIRDQYGDVPTYRCPAANDGPYEESATCDAMLIQIVGSQRGYWSFHNYATGTDVGGDLGLLSVSSNDEIKVGDCAFVVNSGPHPSLSVEDLVPCP